jgi:hypothetical protein
VHWLEKLITDFGIGTDKPGYPFVVSQGHLISTNYIMQLQTQQGGATVDVGQYDLPHNLLVQVNGMPANAIAGRYDLQRKQLLILPVFEQTALTSVNTTVGNTNLYVGELFHCDDSHVVMSCVQDSADKLMLEIHNPTDAARTVKLTSVPGFAPLHGLDKLFELKAYTSTTCELTVSPDSLIQADYRF